MISEIRVDQGNYYVVKADFKLFVPEPEKIRHDGDLRDLLNGEAQSEIPSPILAILRGGGAEYHWSFGHVHCYPDGTSDVLVMFEGKVRQSGSVSMTGDHPDLLKRNALKDMPEWTQP